MLLAAALVVSGCASMGPYSSGDTRFGARENLGLIAHDPIREASGIAASRNNQGVLWTHNDSGSPPAIYALNLRGEHLGTYLLHGCTDGDWEDISIGPGPAPGRDYIYVGAIGDNQARRESRSICRFPEPPVTPGESPVNLDIHDVEVLRFSYPDGSHDAETLMLDPVSGDLLVVTKRVNPVGVYRLVPVFGAADVQMAEPVAGLRMKYVTGGDISPSGSEILIRTYTAIYYWRRGDGETLAETFARPPETVPYTWETGGEAVAWAPGARGYYTVSEENIGIEARLYFYPRLAAPD